MAEIELDIDSNVKKVNRDMKDLSTNTRKSTKDMGGLANKVGKAAIAFFGTQGLISGVSKIIGEFDQASKGARSFTDSITGLVALGGDINEIKADVNALSIEAGIFAKSAADAMFTVRSGAASAGKEIQDQLIRSSIELSKVWGTELPTVTDALVTTFNIYGKEIGSVEKLQSKLNLASIEGKLTFADLARVFPPLAAGAKALKIPFDDVLSSLVVASKESGDLAQSATGLRNALAILTEAEEKGIKTTGTLAERFKALGRSGSALKVFGRESLAAASVFAGSIERGEFQQLRARIAGVSGGEVGARLQERRDVDPQFRLAEELKVAEARRAAGQSGRTLGTQGAILRERVGAEFEERGGGSATLGAATSVLSPAAVLSTLFDGLQLTMNALSNSSEQNLQTSVNQVKTSNSDRGN